MGAVSHISHNPEYPLYLTGPEGEAVKEGKDV